MLRELELVGQQDVNWAVDVASRQKAPTATR